MALKGGRLGSRKSSVSRLGSSNLLGLRFGPGLGPNLKKCLHGGPQGNEWAQSGPRLSKCSQNKPKIRQMEPKRIEKLSRNWGKKAGVSPCPLGLSWCWKIGSTEFSAWPFLLPLPLPSPLHCHCHYHCIAIAIAITIALPLPLALESP